MPHVRTFLLLTLLVALVTAVEPHIAGGQEATPNPSPEATPQFTVQQCAEWDEYTRQELSLLDNYFIAGSEAGLLTAAASDIPPTDRLTPEAAREIAGILDATRAEGESLEPPAFAPGRKEAALAVLTAGAAAFRDYADAVDGGANRNQAQLDHILQNPDYLSTLQAIDAIDARIDAVCDPSIAEEASGARELAALIEDALEAQTNAKTPRVAREANDSLITALQALDVGLLEFADRIKDGEERGLVADEVEVRALPSFVAATDALRDLFERCGIPIGITEPDDGIPPLSNGQCNQVFRWYVETAERMTDLNALDFRFIESGLVIPGGLGSVDLDALENKNR